MALKIKGELFTGPVPFDKANVRPNHPPTVWAVVAKVGPDFDPNYKLLHLDMTIGQAFQASIHPKYRDWMAEFPNSAVYFLAKPDMDKEALGQLIANLMASLPPSGLLR